MPPPPRSPAPWQRRLLHACLLAWPRDTRVRDGAALVTAALDHLAEGHGRPGSATAWRVMTECHSVVAAGLALRASRRVARWRRRAGGAADGGLSGWVKDLRLAARSLARSPGFALPVVLTLSLGVGANAAVFGLVDATLLRPPPFERPHRLVMVWSSLPDRPTHVPVSAPDVAELRHGAPSLAAVAFMNRITDGSVEAREGDAADHVRVALVTADFFDVLGARPALGRTFLPDDAVAPTSQGDAPGQPPAVVLSDGLWRRVFGADPSVLGRTIRLDGVPAVVVGIMAPGFRLPVAPDAGIAADADVWIPLRTPLSAFQRGDGRLVDQDSDNSGVAVARLASGASLRQAQAEADRVAAALRAAVPAYATAGLGFDVRHLESDATAHVRPLLLALGAGAGFLLLVACLGLSTLVLARGAKRRPELAVRLALGATRSDLARGLLTQSAVLLMAGGAAAAVVAFGGCTVLARILPESVALTGRLVPDVRILFLALAAAGGVLTLFGAAPAVRGATSVGAHRSMSGVHRGRRRGRLRNVLVAGEVAASVVLVLAAGLLLRTVRELRDVRPGFDPRDALVFSLSVRTPGRYRSPGDRALLMHDIEREVLGLPGVRSTGLVGHLPLSGRRWTQPYGLPGEPESAWDVRRADFRMVTSGYFDAIGTRLLEGRTFTSDEDLNERRRVVIVDEALARRIAPGGSAVGARIGFPLDGEPVEARVVGVVENVRFEDLESPGEGALYVPYRQEASRDVSFVVRTTGSPLALAPAVRRTLREVDPQLAVYDVRALSDYVAAAVAPRRFALDLLAGYALLALLAAAVGLYGVVSFEVAAGTRDIGVRLAVGATRGRVIASVLVRGLRLALFGLGAGALLAAGAAGTLRHILFGVAVTDVPTWVGVLGIVLAVTLVACGAPALRASRLDPTSALRVD